MFSRLYFSKKEVVLEFQGIKKVGGRFSRKKKKDIEKDLIQEIVI
jgi:hypothetical protein